MTSENMNRIDLVGIFDSAQKSSACHLKHATILKKAVDENAELLEVIYKCIQHAFSTTYKEKNPYMDRMISFIALFAASFKSSTRNDGNGDIQIDPVLNSMFKFILKLSRSANDRHRCWSCRLLNKIFENLEELTDELYDEIKESMMEKLQDGKAVIRCQAIMALHRLQDPTDTEDPIITSLCTLLDSDYNSKVRQLCIEKLAMNKQVIPFVLNRARDIDANVRLTAFEKLSAVTKYLKVAQRRLVLICGFHDASEKNKNYISTVLLVKWLQSYNNDYLALMKAIRLDACQEDIVTTTHLVEFMLRALFKSASAEEIIEPININDEKLIEYNVLNWESVLYYRIAIQYLRQHEGFEEILNRIIPELVQFCQYIRRYVEFMKNRENLDELEYHFTLQQFFLVTEGYDVGDSSSRQSLNSLAHSMLQNENLSTDVSYTIVRNLEKTIPDVNNRSIFVCEIISDIIYGEEAINFEEIERKEQEKNNTISQLQSDIISLEEQEKHLVFIEKNFTEAERVKNEIHDKTLHLKNLRNVRDKPEECEKKTDAGTMSRCLNIAEALLLSPKIREFNPAMATLNSEVIKYALIHEDNGVKEKALKCYALCCIIDQRSARYGIHLFSGLIFAPDLEDLEILKTSIKATVDLLTIYGLSLIEKKEDEEEEASDSRREEEKKVFVGGTSLTDVIQALVDHLQHEDPQVEEVATKGVGLLLLRSRITSPSLLSRLIIKWANPATDNEKLKQFIGLTLESLTTLANCHTYFVDAVLCTIKALVHAPTNSALADINIENLIKFMMTLCHMPSQGPQIHTDIALKICKQMCDRPRVKVNFYFSKTLVLTVPKSESFSELLEICDEIRDIIRDNQILRNVNKFITNINKRNVQLVPIEEIREEEDAMIDN